MNISKKALVLIILVLAIIVPVTVKWEPLTGFAKERYEDLQLFTRVLNLVQEYYVEPVDTKKLIYGGVKGMLRELDPHTNFLPPEIFKEFESETQGEFGGLGVEITVQNGILTVISPIEDTPAYKAGVQAGDKIVAIDGKSTKGFSLVEAAKMMRGRNGSKIKLTVAREGLDDTKDIIVTRGVVKIQSVKYTDLEDGYAYVRITSFIENTFNDLKNALVKHEAKTKSIKGLVIDLRQNPGGLLEQAIKVSDLFLEEGVIVSTMGRNKAEKDVVSAKKAGTYSFFPVVILMDEYSASASEIVAGALQDNKRALIMGQKSFGKGSVQNVVRLGDGSGLKLTVARYYTPSGKSIQAEGIVPDVVLEELKAEVPKNGKESKKDIRREADIEGHLENEKKTTKKKDQQWWLITSTGKPSDKEKLLAQDFQVTQGYNYLKAWNVLRANEGKTELKVDAETKKQ